MCQRPNVFVKHFLCLTRTFCWEDYGIHKSILQYTQPIKISHVFIVVTKYFSNTFVKNVNFPIQIDNNKTNNCYFNIEANGIIPIINHR